MDFQDTNIMETTCNSKPRGKIESVAFGWIDIDIYVLTSTLFEINWIFLFFFSFDKMDVGFLYETDVNVTWKKMCFSRGYYSFDQGTCYKSTSYFLKSYGSVFFWFCNLHRQTEHFQTLKNWYISPRNGWTLQRGSVACYGEMTHSTTLDFCWTININVCIDITTRLTT